MNLVNNIENSERYIGSFFNHFEQPTAIFLAAIHGNEKSGIKALEIVCQEITNQQIPLRGNIIALKGNLQAIKADKRFITKDLNRCWTTALLKNIQNNTELAEAKEVIELKKIIDFVIAKTKSKVLFMDLHTTSSHSPPFTIIDDTLRNREIALKLPVTNVLGITEKLKGTISGYYNDKGPVSIVFEAGQHFEQSSINRHVAAIWLTLVNFGIIQKSDIAFNKHYNCLYQAAKNSPKLVETTLRYALHSNDKFVMEDGFQNFSAVRKGQKIATHNGKDVITKRNELIFMPLYQNQGNDGFFLVRKISKFWLTISEFLRKQHLEKIMTLLPGIKKDTLAKDTFIVNTKIASFKALGFLHLLGFRKKRMHNNLLYVSRLPYDIKGPWENE